MRHIGHPVAEHFDGLTVSVTDNSAVESDLSVKVIESRWRYPTYLEAAFCAAPVMRIKAATSPTPGAYFAS